MEVKTARQCEWAANVSAGWLNVTRGARGMGSGRVTVAADANPSPQPRAGKVSVAGESVDVTQAGVSCTFKVTPDRRNVSARGDFSSFKVKTDRGCAWTARSNSAWITIASGASGTGDGEVAFEAAPNRDKGQREGTLTIAGQVVTVRQH